MDSQVRSEPRPASKLYGLLHRCAKTSCATSSAAAGARVTRTAIRRTSGP